MKVRDFMWQLRTHKEHYNIVFVDLMEIESLSNYFCFILLATLW